MVFGRLYRHTKKKNLMQIERGFCCKQLSVMMAIGQNTLHGIGRAPLLAKDWIIGRAEKNSCGKEK